MTVVLLLACTGWILFGAFTDDPELFRGAAPIAGMAIATGTLALVRKP
jgi:hypothetical protein